MNIRRWGTVAVLGAALVAGGCGADEELERRQEQGRATQQALVPIKADLTKLGSEVGAAVKVAPEDAQADAFEALGKRTNAIQESVAALEVPESEIPERDALAAALAKAVGTLEAIAQAAEDDNAAEVRKQFDQLVKDAPPITDAQAKLEGALRHLTGQGLPGEGGQS